MQPVNAAMEKCIIMYVRGSYMKLRRSTVVPVDLLLLHVMYSRTLVDLHNFFYALVPRLCRSDVDDEHGTRARQILRR